MIRRSLFATVLTVACTGLFAAAADPATATAPATTPAAAPDSVKLYLMDGSVLAGRLGTPQIDIQTKYGVLKVPLNDIRTFTPGLASHSDFNEKLQGMINDLGADGFAEREKATEALRKLGPDIRNELNEALKTAETEKQARLTKLIEEIDQGKSSLPDDDSSETWMHNDMVVTPDFTISGQILTKSFMITSNYGPLTVKLADIKTVRKEGAVSEDLKKSITVSGTLISQRTFENSNLKVNKGDIVTVVATGSLSMPPWGGGAVSGPDGGNFGVMQPGNMPGGSLIAKVGQSGPLFKVGAKNKFVVDRAGVLMFGIAMPPEYSSNYQFPGQYDVKITVTRKAP